MVTMDAHTLAALADLYLLRCEVEGKSPRTVRAYRWTLDRFLTALREDGAPDDPHAITREHLYRYFGRFTEHAPDTRHRYFREVRCFFNWLADAGYVEQSPFRGMKNIRLPRRIVRPFSVEEVGRLLAACGDEPVGLRDRALLMVLLDTGARCSEVAQPDLADVDPEARRIRIRFGKGAKQRTVPFAQRCRDALAVYLAQRGDAPGALFLASSGHGAPPRDGAPAERPEADAAAAGMEDRDPEGARPAPGPRADDGARRS